MESEESSEKGLIGRLDNLSFSYTPNDAGGATLYFREGAAQRCNLASTAVYRSPLSKKYILVEEFTNRAFKFFPFLHESPKGRVVRSYEQEDVAKESAVAHIKELGRKALANRQTKQKEDESKLDGSTPFCNTCGHITVRSGAGYNCLNCGSSI